MSCLQNQLFLKKLTNVCPCIQDIMIFKEVFLKFELFEKNIFYRTVSMDLANSSKN